MITNDFTITLAKWSMDVQSQRAKLTASNIANANSTGIRKTADFDSLINSMSSAIQHRDIPGIDSLLLQSAKVSQSPSSSKFNSVSLDQEILELSSAKGKYKMIAEMLNRKFGLMAIAAKGR